MRKYAVVDRPGYFGGNKARVYSSHKRIDLAIRAMKRHSYLSEQGKKLYLCCVVTTDKAKGAVVWGDMFPDILA